MTRAIILALVLVAGCIPANEARRMPNSNPGFEYAGQMWFPHLPPHPGACRRRIQPRGPRALVMATVVLDRIPVTATPRTRIDLDCGYTLQLDRMVYSVAVDPWEHDVRFFCLPPAPVDIGEASCADLATGLDQYEWETDIRVNTWYGWEPC